MRYVYFIISTCTCSMWIDFMNTYNIYKIIINWPSFSNCVVGRCLTFAWTHHHLEKICPCFSPSMGSYFKSKFVWKNDIYVHQPEKPQAQMHGRVLCYYTGGHVSKLIIFRMGETGTLSTKKQMSSTKFEGRIRLILRRQFISIYKVHDWNPIFKIFTWMGYMGYTLWKPTWQWKHPPFEDVFVLQMVIFPLHVGFLVG